MIIAGTALLDFTPGIFFLVTFHENQFRKMLRSELFLEVIEQVQFSIINNVIIVNPESWCINNFIASLQEYEVLSMAERIEDHLEMEKVFKNGMINKH